jgi:hypothetical protein
LRNQWPELSNVLSDFSHEPLGEGLVLKTFVYVVEKASTKERMMEELGAWASLHFKRILKGLDSIQITCFEPASRFLR